MNQPSVSKPGPPRHRWRSLGRAVSWHRRKLAVVAAVAAVLTGIAAVEQDRPPTLQVVRATSGIIGGAVVRPADVEVREVLVADVPEGATRDPAEVVGRRVAAPVAEGQVLTPLILVPTRAAGAPGRVIAPLRLVDADVVSLLRPGEVVDVVATDQQAATASVVASAVRVVAIPAVAEPDGAQSGALVLVEVPRDEATALARAAIGGPLTIIWR